MAQIGYVMLGTNDLARAIAFYDSLLSTLGATHFIEADQGVSWTFGPGSTSISIVKPYDGQMATVGNGVMVAIGVAHPSEVDRVHGLALELGGRDEGAPGPRGNAGFYAGYFRDLDGNKLNIFCIERRNA